MKTLLAILMLAAVEAHAATFEWDLNKVQPNVLHLPCDQIRIVTKGGITATFGESFVYSYSLNGPGESGVCGAYYGVPGWDNGYLTPGLYQNDAAHGNWAARFDVSGQGCTETGSVEERSIYFSTPIRYFRCDIIGVTGTNVWTCDPVVCSTDGGVTWNTHCTVEGSPFYPGSILNVDGSSRIVTMSGPDPINNTTATAYLSYENGFTGCYEEPEPSASPEGPFDWSHSKDPMCVWQTIEIVSPVPVNRVFFWGMGGGYFQPMFIDNIVASTGTCPNPPCEFRAMRPREEGGAMPAVEVRRGTSGLPPGLLIKDLGVTPAARTSWGQLKVIYR